MAIPATRPRHWNHSRVPTRLLLVGLTLALVIGGAYAVVASNPVSRGQKVPAYQTTSVAPGTLTPDRERNPDPSSIRKAFRCPSRVLVR
jgi:hypothetical protein